MTTGLVHFFDEARFMSGTGGITGGTVYFYYTGTTNPAPIYTDLALTIPMANPVVIAQGAIVPNIYLDPSITYRRRIVFSDTSVQDVDPIPGAPVAAGILYTPPGSGAVSRTISDKLTEFRSVKDFGAKGDGATNDTAALALAIAAQPFLRWPAGTYMVDSLPSPPAGCDWVADGQVIIKRRAASTANALVNFTGACQIKGITFDGNKAANSNPCNSVVVTSTTSFFDECKFINAKASGGYGSGFIIDQATASEDADHALWNCYAYGNDADGFAGQNVHGLEAFGNVAYSNSQHGFHFDNLDVTFTKKLFDFRVIGNYAYNNGLDGIYFGNFLATNTTSPPIYGIAGYESYRVVIEANVCRNNGAYGIAAQGYNLLVQGNICNANAQTAGYAGGILLNAYYSKADGNVVEGNLGFGIDAGGASYSLVSDNMVRGNSGTGINSGGAIAINVKNNTVIDNGGTSGRQIDVYAVETDSSGVALPDLSATAVIQGNTISVTSTNWGIFIQDGCSEPKVIDNVFLGPDPLRYLVMIAKGGVVKNNVCDAGTSRLLAPDGGGKLTVPEIFDFCYTNSATTITSIDYFSANGQVGRTGVAWIAMTSGGSGYTSSFAVTFTGGGGSGATGTAYVRNGSVVGVRMTSYGSGYTSTPTPDFSAGSGTGAAGTAQVGVPLPDFRELEIYTNTACTINRAGNPVVESPAAADLSMTARGAVRLRSIFGRWNVMSRAA